MTSLFVICVYAYRVGSPVLRTQEGTKRWLANLNSAVIA
jgi:hypothetical protein